MQYFTDKYESVGVHLRSHVLLLLRYGGHVTSTCYETLHMMMKQTTLCVRPILELCLASMPHRHFSSFKTYIVCMHNSDELMKEWEMRTRSSLSSICRLVVYDHVPRRRMAEYVDRLPLPAPLKLYLEFR